MPNGGSGRPAARRSPAPGPSHPPRPPAAGNRLRRLPGGRRGRSGTLAPPPRRGWMWPRPRPSLLSYSAGRHSALGRTTRPPAAGGEKGREPRPLPSAAAGLAVGIPSPPSPPLSRWFRPARPLATAGAPREDGGSVTAPPPAPALLPRACRPPSPPGPGAMSDSDSEEGPDRQLKLVVLGDGTCGKVSAGPAAGAPGPSRPSLSPAAVATWGGATPSGGHPGGAAGSGLRWPGGGRRAAGAEGSGPGPRIRCESGAQGSLWLFQLLCQGTSGLC